MTGKIISKIFITKSLKRLLHIVPKTLGAPTSLYFIGHRVAWGHYVGKKASFDKCHFPKEVLSEVSDYFWSGINFRKPANIKTNVDKTHQLLSLSEQDFAKSVITKLCRTGLCFSIRAFYCAYNNTFGGSEEATQWDRLDRRCALLLISSRMKLLLTGL